MNAGNRKEWNRVETQDVASRGGKEYENEEMRRKILRLSMGGGGMNVKSTMKHFVKFGKVAGALFFVVFFLSVFANGVEAASCSFTPSTITGSMHGADRKSILKCDAGFHITCSSSVKGQILGNTKCTGDSSTPVTVEDNSKDTTITCTTTNDSTGAAETCSILFSAESSSSTCNASYCKTDCNASTDDTTQTACKSVCTDSSKPNYCPPKSTTTTTTTTTTTSSGTSVSITLANPLKYSTVQQVLMALLYALQGVIVVLSLVFIVIGAVLYITSGGNQGRVTMAKTAITAALIGLAIGILAPTFLKEIATVLGWNSTASLPSEVSSARSAADILLSVLNFLLGIVGVLSIIMLVVGGGMFLTAAGSQDRITTGKKIVTYALLGVVVALASLVIVRQLATFFAA